LRQRTFTNVRWIRIQWECDYPISIDEKSHSRFQMEENLPVDVIESTAIRYSESSDDIRTILKPPFFAGDFDKQNESGSNRIEPESKLLRIEDKFARRGHVQSPEMLHSVWATMQNLCLVQLCLSLLFARRSIRCSLFAASSACSLFLFVSDGSLCSKAQLNSRIEIKLDCGKSANVAMKTLKHTRKGG
jgi:hypothetical protein